MITIILPQIDGARLKEWKRKNPRWIRAQGGRLGSETQEALEHKEDGLFISAQDWERIFGCPKP